MFQRASTIRIGLQNDLIPIFESSIPYSEHTESNCYFVKVSALVWKRVNVGKLGTYQNFTKHYLRYIQMKM